jgi:hypothetical protein
MQTRLTNGCLEVWQTYSPSLTPVNGAELLWRGAPDLPGAVQMRFLRRLVESRPFLARIPDRSLIVVDSGHVRDHVEATRAAGGSYAFLCLPSGQAVTVDLDKLPGDRLAVHWYDPRTETALSTAEIPAGGERVFTPPATWGLSGQTAGPWALATIGQGHCGRVLVP